MRTTLTLRRPVAALAAAAALALTLAACGNSSTPTTAASPTAATDSAAVAAAHTDPDVTFINDMAPHHSGAIEMARLAAGQAGNAQVKDLANRIAGAQGPEIDRMKMMASAWQVNLNTDMHGMGGGMAGAGGDDVAALMPLRGAAFDKEFLTRMTAHHTSAVQMAKAELAQGTNPQARALASAVVSAQEKELAEMAKLMNSV